MTDQHLALLRQIAKQAIATDQDIALSSNIVVAMLDEIARLRDLAEQWERRARELDNDSGG